MRRRLASLLVTIHRWCGTRLEAITDFRTRPLHFDLQDQPVVSAIVSADSGTRSLFLVLRALARNIDADEPLEIIVMDHDASVSTLRFIRSCSGIRIASSSAPLKKGDALDAAIALVRGKYVHFLRDARLTPRSLKPLLRTVTGESDIAAATSQIRSVSNVIVEAGSDLQPTGRVIPWGAGCKSNDPRVNYVRDVLCSSMSSLLVSRQALRSVGNFAALKTSADCAQALCTALRKHGLRIVYQPESVALVPNARAASPAFSAAQTAQRERALLVIDDYVPFFDRSAGGKRMFEILNIMRALRRHIIFMPDEGGAHQPYTRLLQQLGIEVQYRWRRRSLAEEIRALRDRVEIAWLSRPHVCAKYLPVLRNDSRIRVIFDTVDLHYRRLAFGEAVEGTSSGWHRMRDLELELARNADHTIVTTEDDRRSLAAEGIRAITIVPVIQRARSGPSPGFASRRDLLFLGNYVHKPNEDAVRWLCAQIMPIVSHDLPEVLLTLAGAQPTPKVFALSSKVVRVPGYVPDLQPVLDRHRIFVAPLRYGAGIKGKVIEALAYGIPVVTTTVGAQGISLRHGRDALLADTPEQFAESVIQLYRNADLWHTLSQNGRNVATQFTPEAIRPVIARVLSRDSRGAPPVIDPPSRFGRRQSSVAPALDS